MIIGFVIVAGLLLTGTEAAAQQLGEGPAKGMNSGILYLAFAPMAIIGFLAYRWIKNNRQA